MKKLIFVHHSCGEYWLYDGNGGLGKALMEKGYFVSDTNYRWGPEEIGSRTDIGHWWSWFRGPLSAAYLKELYNENGKNSSYTRNEDIPEGENDIIMFKSCYPNSMLRGDNNEQVPPISDNCICGKSVSSLYTVANVKGIYIDILEYFKTRQDKLFIVITAPPLRDETYSSNARAFNNWLTHEWLIGYPYKNVRVFDFYNVMTSNGGSADTNDLNEGTGNHHRVKDGVIQHIIGEPCNILKYQVRENDNHPGSAGNMKATVEFLSLLDVFYNEWQASLKT